MAWIAGILKLVLVDLIKAAGQAILNLIKNYFENRKREKEKKKNLETAERIENETDRVVIRDSVDDLP